MTLSLIKIILKAIKKYCADKKDVCTKCPFNISDSWHEYCMFMGNIPHEGIIPAEWQLDKIDFKDDFDVYAIRKQDLDSTYGSCAESYEENN